jgi:hypothetical protein
MLDSTIKTIVLNGETTKNNLRNAIIVFRDTMRQVFGTSNKRDTRYIGAKSRGGGRGRGQGLHNYVGRNQGRGGGRFAGGRGRNGQQYQGSRGRGGQRDGNSFYIPNEVLQWVGPKYQAMLFKGREQMEKESSKDESSNTPRNVNATTVTEVPEISKTKTDDDDGTATRQFGATGRKKRRTINGVTTSIRRIGKAFTVTKPND